MSSIQFLGAIELGLIYGLVAAGVYLSFRVLDFPDLTADGSFPLGAAIASTLIIYGTTPWLATATAMVGGALAGSLTAWLNTRWKILHLLAGILTMTALYSINLRIMGRPNIAIMSEDTVFTTSASIFPYSVANIVVISFVVLAIIVLLYRFLSSEVGLAIRTTGQNPRMATAHGIKTDHMILLGIALSNSLIALGGALFAQSQGFADISMGVGTIIFGLAAVLIGEAILPTRGIIGALCAAVVGSIIYRLVIALALDIELGLNASDLNLVSAVLVAMAMILARARVSLREYLVSKRASR